MFHAAAPHDSTDSNSPEQEEFFECRHCAARIPIHGRTPLETTPCPSCGQPVTVPASLSTFKILSLLGEGSMGRVYLARDTTLERDVAIKILRRNLASTPSMWQLLEREARAAGAIRHHNVAQVYSLGKTHGRPFMVMELVPNGSLESLMHQKTLSEVEALDIGVDIAQGLRAALDSGLLHGDVKPANILFSAKGEAKVADFGLARLVGREQNVERWGTPYYIAPEKSTQRQEDFRCDLYSLGASLFHALCGRAPFEAESGEEVIEKSLIEPTPWPRDHRPDLGNATSDILYRMLQRDPDRRFASYNHAIQAMKAALKGEYVPGRWEGARKLRENNLLSRLRRAWEGKDREEDLLP